MNDNDTSDDDDERSLAMDDNDTSDDDDERSLAMEDNDTSDDDDERSLTSIEREQAAADERCAKLITVLQRKREFSNRTRNKTDALVQSFLHYLEADIYDMLCESGIDSCYYSEEDTEAEIETAIRFFPNVLSSSLSQDVSWDAEEPGEFVPLTYPNLHPIHRIIGIRDYGVNYCCNYKSAPFIMLFVRLAIEFDQFTEELRGGLLCENINGSNVLQSLMSSSNLSFGRDHNRLVDETFLEVLIQLRRIGLLKKEDIRRYGLLNRLLTSNYYFAENRFRFLVEWDPSAVREANNSGSLPLHNCNKYNKDNHNFVERFQLVFEYGIRYYPKKIGISLLFKKDSNGITPFQVACSNIAHGITSFQIDNSNVGYEDTMKAIEDSLGNNTAGPYNVVDALITAAIDEHVHLDCVYFLLRREPDVLVKLLSSSTASLTLTDSPINDINSNSNSNSNRNSKKRKCKGKRKRGS